MLELAVLKAMVTPEPEADPIAKLFAVAGELVKRPTPNAVQQLPIASLRVDPDYQRPVNREKVAEIVEHLRVGGTVDPIQVNERDDGSHWIVDGQHRAAAAAICGRKQIAANVHSGSLRWEAEQVTKAAGRIPAGDPRRGRIHPGEWTKENNPATLKKAAEDARSYSEKAVIHHRLAQLHGTHAVAGLLSDEKVAEHEEGVREARKRTTKTGARQAVLGTEYGDERRRQDAEREILGYSWRDSVLGAAFRKLPEYKRAVRRKEAAARAANKATQGFSEKYPGWSLHGSMNGMTAPQERDYRKGRKTWNAMLEARDAEARLEHDYGLGYGRFHNPNASAEKLGVDFDKHLAKHKTKIDRRVREMVEQEIVGEIARGTEQLAHHQGALKHHAEAKRLATGRARTARHTKPGFEKQSLAGQFIGDLKKHPGRVRAIFLEDSILKDHVAYSEWTRPLRPSKVWTVPMYANFAYRQLEGLDAAQASGWHKACNTAIQLAGKKVTRADVERHVDKYLPRLKGTRIRGKAIKLLQDHIAAGVGVAPVETFVWRRQKNFEFRTYADVPAEHEDQLVDALVGAGAKVTPNEVFIPEYRSWSDRAMDDGKRFTLDLGQGRKIHYVPHYTVGTKQVAKYKHTYSYGGWSGQKRAALLKKIDAEIGNGGSYYAEEAWRQLRTLVEKAPKNPIQITTETEQFGAPELRGQHFYSAVKGQRWPVGVKGRIYGKGVYTGAVDQFFTNELWSHTRAKGEGRKAEPHRAPYSERGVLKLENMPPAEAVRAMRRLGVAKGMVEDVPHNLIYRGERRFGRLQPHHEDYTTGDAAVSLHAGYGIFHGITGSGKYSIIDSFEQLVEDGGLQSIAERRRLGRTSGGMSVKGDTGSGIDQYLFTNLATSPHYGSGGLTFGLKPSVLKRRDIAFAPRDYGGGSERWSKYNAHAKRIGQGRFVDPPSAKARQKHLDNHLGRHDSEVLLKHEIPWEDVDTLYVGEQHYPEILKRVQRHQRAGRLPKTLRVSKGYADMKARLAEMSPDQD